MLALGRGGRSKPPARILGLVLLLSQLGLIAGATLVQRGWQAIGRPGGPGGSGKPAGFVYGKPSLLVAGGRDQLGLPDSVILRRYRRWVELRNGRRDGRLLADAMQLTAGAC